MPTDLPRAMIYLDRAESYLRSVTLLDDRALLGEELEQHRFAVALLAVHSGIAFADAVLMARRAWRSTAQNHQEAADHLARVCNEDRLDDRGVSHYRWLVANKDGFAYGDRRVQEKDVQSAVLKIQRLASWVYETFVELRRN